MATDPVVPELTEAHSSPPSPDESTEESAKVGVELSGVAETLLIPLYARAFDAATEKPILGDMYAIGVLEQLDYNFEKSLMPPLSCAGVAVRTRQFDRWIAAFLVANRRATVLHLACGLDSRPQRLDWGDGVRWIDLDLPEVVGIRRRVLPESFPGRDYRLVAASVTDDAWLEGIPADRPTIVVMEGLLSYLAENEVVGLLKRLVERFGQGELLFESINSFVMEMGQRGQTPVVSRTGAEFRWAVDDPKELEKVHQCLAMMESIRFCETPTEVELPETVRAVMGALAQLPGVRDSARFLRFKFSPQA